MNAPNYFETSVWVISFSNETGATTALLTYLAENIVYMPGSRHYPMILAFTAKDKAKAYLTQAKLNLHEYEIVEHRLWDIVTRAMDLPCNVAIDKRGNDSPHVFINVIKMMADIRKEGYTV